MTDMNNEFLKKMNQTVMNDSWLKNVYGQQKKEQQETIKKVFNVIADNDIDETQLKTLEKRKEQLEEKVKKLETKLAALAEELSKNQEEIDKKAREIEDLVSSADTKGKQLENKQASFVKMAIEDVFYEYQHGIIDRDNITVEIRKRLQNNSYLDRASGEIEKILARLDGKQSEVKGLVDRAADWIDDRRLLESQYGSTKSTYELLNSNLRKIGALETNYTNSDVNTNVPIYSLEKTDIVSKYFEDTSINVKPGINKNYVAGSTQPTLETIKEKYKSDLNIAQTQRVAINSSNNVAVQGLTNAVNKGLLNDLKSTGLSSVEVAQFLADNFKGTKLSMNNANTLNVPYGDDSIAINTFSKINNFFSTYDSSIMTNTWDKEGGNTISSNKQLESLAKNYKEIMTDMGTNEPRFTFKEAMYALFDSQKGLFKDCGVNYKLDKQTGAPSYSIDPAGDKETSQMYSDMSKLIYDIWGVSLSKVTTRVIDAPPPPAPKGDPLTFRDANGVEHAFVIDRNKDNIFNSSEEFVGAKDGTTWLEDLKSLDSDGDGKLTGDELKALKILSLDYTDNAQTKSDGKYLREETTNIKYSISNAQKFGIEEIDLRDLEKSVNISTGKTDINDSEIFEDSFTFKIGDNVMTASRKDETQSFMKAIYGDAFGKGFTVGSTAEEIDEIISKDYGEMEHFNTGFAGTFQNLNLLQNAGQIARDTRDGFNDVLRRIAANESTQLQRASNKAASFSNASDWSNISQKVQQIAASEGISIDMTQAKGIYTRNGSLDARGVVNEYKNLIQQEEQIKKEQNYDKEIWSAVILCAKHNVKTSLSEIKKMFMDGTAQTAQDVLDKLYVEEEFAPDDRELTLDKEREKEIYNSFDKTFTEAGMKDKTVEALYDLVVEQTETKSTMQGKSGDELAEMMLQKYKNV